MAKDRLAKGMYWDKVWNPIERLDAPLHWKKPRRIAVNVSGDPFREEVSDEILDRAFAVMSLCRQHTLILLTKRWEGMAEHLNDERNVDQIGWYARDMIKGNDEAVGWCATDQSESERLQRTISDPLINGDGWPLPNVWLGVSVSTQAELDAARPYLLATPAAVRVPSVEPVLESVDVTDCVRPSVSSIDYAQRVGHDRIGEKETIDGLIVGCESGPNRRPCKIEWIESIVAQCKAASVPVFVKQVCVDYAGYCGLLFHRVNGRVSKDPTEWPESIRVRELPG